MLNKRDRYFNNKRGIKWGAIQGVFSRAVTEQKSGHFFSAWAGFFCAVHLFCRAILIELNLVSPNDREATRGSQRAPEKYFLFNHHYRLIYCPIHKVASSTLINQLILSNNTDIDFDVNNNGCHGYAETHCSLATLAPDEASLLLLDSRYLKLVFVRNPWGRLVSAYLNKFVTLRPKSKGLNQSSLIVLKAHYKRLKLPIDYKKSISFRQFVDYLMVTDDRDLDNHWLPQILFVGNQQFDFIGKYENISSDFERFTTLSQLPLTLVKTNATNYASHTINSHENYCDYSPHQLRQLTGFPQYKYFYTPELIECVRHRYQEDIQRFGYTFGN